jgi:nitroreductase/NAD-dependent dihydropyrimidine dehydrogenase PreA subunit
LLNFTIDADKCISCGECAADCPAGIIAMNPLPEITAEEQCFQCQHCYAVCPTGALSILGHTPDTADEPLADRPTPKQMATLIKGRLSIRRYKDENLPQPLLDELLATAAQAPTGVNTRDVLFTVVRDKAFMTTLSAEIRARLTKLAQAGELPDGFVGTYLRWVIDSWNDGHKDVLFRGAPHLLVTSAPSASPCPVQDTHIALSYFELLANTNGLGTLWDGIFMMALSVCPDIAKLLGIPADHTVGYAMVFGKPAVKYHRAPVRDTLNVNSLG